MLRESRIERCVSAAAVLFALAGCGRPHQPPAATAIDRLRGAVPASSRRMEARIAANVPWAPLDAATAATEDDAELEVAAGEILTKADREPTAENVRASGVARALLGSYADSATRLERVCAVTPGNPRAWSDLAAARYELARTRRQPQYLPGALSAADHAVEEAPHLAEALFNRALILTALGIRDEALGAWTRAAKEEHDGRWLAEIRSRATAVRGSASRPAAALFERALASLDRGDPTLLKRFVAEYAQETRSFAESKLLSEWADLERAGRASAAATALSHAVRVGELTGAANGDWLTRDVAAIIDGSTASGRRTAADAYVAYREARIRYATRAASSATELCRAADLFHHGHNPMEHVARYYCANALLDANHFDDSRRMLDKVLSSISAGRYPTLAAGAEKELGLYYGFRGMWTSSLTHLERSQALYAAHNEPVNAAFVEATTGEAYDLLGDFGRGWRHRIAALDVLTRSGPIHRAVPVLIGAVRAEIMRHDYASALSLVRVAEAETRQISVPDYTAEMMLSAARVLTAERRNAEARAAAAGAARAIATIEDRELRARFDCERALVLAAIERLSEPRRAVQLAADAVDFLEGHRLDILLPAAYLERGRAYEACGRDAAARLDFEAGLRWIEWQRENARVDIRTSLFDTVPELTSELVDLMLRHGDVASAYATVERARARTLTDALGLRPPTGKAGVRAVMRTLPPHGVVVEYALLPDGVAAFCIRRDGLTVRRLQVQPAALRQDILTLRDAIQHRQPVEDIDEVASHLYDELLRPLESVVADATVLYVSPDRFLNAIPMAVLYDSRSKQHLIQRFRLILVPSGSFVLQRPRKPLSIRPAFVLADPTSPVGGRRLDAAREAALSIARLFDAPPPLVGRDATIARFVANAPNSAMIHYGGHAGSDDPAGGFLPLAPSGGNDGRLDAAAISRLHLDRTSLVVLSACGTMRGDVSSIEGMPSLSRAFLAAHAKSVIGMLWEVDDEPSAALLAAFHRRLRDAMSPSRALQEAQLEMMRSNREDLRHPATWAAAAFLGAD